MNKWKDWPYWLRGGVIGGVIGIIDVICALVTFNTPLGIITILPYIILSLVPYFVLVGLGGARDTTFFYPVVMIVAPTILGQIYLVLFYALLGLFIGWLIQPAPNEELKSSKELKPSKRWMFYGALASLLIVFAIIFVMLVLPILILRFTIPDFHFGGISNMISPAFDLFLDYFIIIPLGAFIGWIIGKIKQKNNEK